jgi:hypothetical protein
VTTPTSNLDLSRFLDDAQGLVLDNGVVAALTGARRRAVDLNNEYRLAPDYRGIFVGVRVLGAMQIRTYLRMHSSQEE